VWLSEALPCPSWGIFSGDNSSAASTADLTQCDDALKGIVTDNTHSKWPVSALIELFPLTSYEMAPTHRHGGGMVYESDMFHGVSLHEAPRVTAGIIRCDSKEAGKGRPAIWHRMRIYAANKLMQSPW
jgi:hypothetical protein